MYAYIDESGLSTDQRLLVVALVVLSGKRSADNLHLSVSEFLFAEANKNARSTRAGRSKIAAQKLHYCKMDALQKRDVVERLAIADVEVYVAMHWFDGEEFSHGEKCGLYNAMVAATVDAALKDHDEIHIVAGNRGGECEHEGQLKVRIDDIAREHSQRGQYKKVNFEYSGNHNKGIQIADFYAGSFRDATLQDDSSCSTLFETLQHQLREQITVPRIGITSVLIVEEARLVPRLF